MVIHQVLVGAAYGDAITNEAFRLQTALREKGCDSSIFAVYVDPRLHGVSPLDRFESPGATPDLLVVHLSIGEPRLMAFLEARSEPVLLRYAGITPPEYYAQYDKAFADLLQLGRQHVASLASRASFAIAMSTYGKNELLDLGYTSVDVCPLLVSVDTLLGLQPVKPAPLPSDRHPFLLYVGRFVPNKAIDEILLAFHVLKTYHAPDAVLALIGGQQFRDYHMYLTALVSDMGLRDAIFVGRIDASELAWAYRKADALLCLSRHEGFCAPLVEAMAFGVPVVAIDDTAVGETLDGGGILLNERRPSLVAEALVAAISDDSLRRRLTDAGKRRAEDFDVTATARRLASQILAAA